MKTLFTFFVLSIASILIVYSCSKWDLDRIQFTRVITVGVIEVGASSAFLIGDIEDLREGNVIETGFVYSTTVQNESNLQLGKDGVQSKISLRTDTTADRAFAVRLIGLETNTSYSFRAYIKLEQEITPIYGQIDSFSTPDLTLEILSIQRQSLDCPTKAVITLDIGQNQSTDMNAGIVWTDSEDNLAPTLENANVLTGLVSGSNDQIQVGLDLECGNSYFIRGFILPQGSLPVFTKVVAFSTATGGKWFQREDFPKSLREISPDINHFSFSIAGKGYLGDGGCQPSSEVWEYDALTDKWSPTLVEGIERRDGISFTIGKVGYVGTGLEPPESCPQNLCTQCIDCECYCLKDDLWRLKDGSWQKIAFALPKLSSAGSFVIGGNAYFGAGRTFEGCFEPNTTFKRSNSFWRFNPSSGITSVDPLPDFNITLGTQAFSIGDKGYVGGTSSIRDLGDLNFYEFDPTESSGNQWKRIADRQAGGGVMVLGSKAFFVDGFLHDYITWEFDPAKSSPWRQVATLTVGGTQTRHIQTFSINNLGYVLLQREADNFWMYVPEL